MPSFGEKMTQFGEKLIGRGPEVGVRNDIDALVRSGSTREQAEKSTLHNRMSLLLGELNHEGTFNNGSETPRNFEAVFNELFGSENIEQFKKDAVNPAIFRTIGVSPVTPREANAARAGFTRHFNGEAPTYPIINDCAEKRNLIEALSARLMGHPGMNPSNAIDMRNVLRVNPELGADIGAIMIAIEEQQRHDRMFEREIKFGESASHLKETAREQLSQMFLDAPLKFLKDMSKLPIKPDFKSFIKGFAITAEATTKLLAKEGWAASKLLISATGTSLRYLNTLRR